MTEGSAASNRGDAKNDEELGTIRRGEFAKACALLNVHRGEVLDYPDGKLAQVDFVAVVTMLVEYIRRYRPQVVLTFGSDGGPNMHRDHTMVNFFTTAAFHWAGRSFFAPHQLLPQPEGAGLTLYAPQKLYYPSTLFTVSKFKEEAALVAKTPASLVLSLGESKTVKHKAVEVHVSQGVMDRAGEMYAKYGHEENYLLAAARRPELMGKEVGMFEGIVED